MGGRGRSTWFCLIPCPSLPPSAPDIRLDWETYAPEEKEDQLVELLVFYGTPFPLQDQAGNDLLSPEIPDSSSSFWSPSVSNESLSSQEAAQSVSEGGVSDWLSRCG